MKEHDRIVHILIAEDSAIQAEKLRRVLAADGYSVDVAKDGAEGLQKARVSAPDLVISDIMMPEMNGFELCKQIKNDPGLSTTPVILLTSLADPADVISGLECGADNFIVKPYDDRQLLARVRQLLLNHELQNDEQTQMGVEIYFSGKKYFITSEKRQILALLISTYENAVQKNIELMEIQDEFRQLNEQLEQRVSERNAKLFEEFDARIKAEEAVLAAAREWSASFDAMSDGVSIHDSDFLIINANKSLLHLLGKTAAEVIGKKCFQIFHGTDCPVAACPLAKTMGDLKETSVELFEPEINKWLTVSTSPVLDESGCVKRIIHTVRDVTEHKMLEEQLRHSQKMEAIGTLAGGIAHDFNNILTTIIGYGEITLMKMPNDDPLRGNIQTMLESADRAATLTRSLLTFSRKQLIQRKQVDVNSILTRVEKLLIRIIGEDVEIRMNFRETALTVFADEDHLEQVFMNLATNARDAMPDGGTFVIETSAVDLGNNYLSANHPGAVGNFAMISVTDNGCGMNAETSSKIFEPFFTTKEIGKGTGLGLSMVYGILTQNDGLIDVSSQPGKGTTFRIFLPLVTAEDVVGESPVASEHSERGNETILLAEDDENVKNLYVLVLEQMGYTVIAVGNGEEAVQRFMENRDKIQLLLFDIVMPKMNGGEAYAVIKKIKSDIPVIFSSGYSSDLLRIKAMVEDGTEILNKPVSPANLLKMVRSVLSKQGTGHI